MRTSRAIRLIGAALVLLLWPQFEARGQANATRTPDGDAGFRVAVPDAAVRAAGIAALRARVDAERAQVRAILDAAVRSAGDMTVRARALPPGPDRDALLFEVVALKRQAWLEALRLRGRFARTHGDTATAGAAARAIASLVAPRVSAPVSDAAKPADAAKPGGAR